MKNFCCVLIIVVMTLMGWTTGTYFAKGIIYARTIRDLRIREVAAQEQILLVLKDIRSDLSVSLALNDVKKQQIGNCVYYLEK